MPSPTPAARTTEPSDVGRVALALESRRGALAGEIGKAARLSRRRVDAALAELMRSGRVSQSPMPSGQYGYYLESQEPGPAARPRATVPSVPTPAPRAQVDRRREMAAEEVARFLRAGLIPAESVDGKVVADGRTLRLPDAACVDLDARRALIDQFVADRYQHRLRDAIRTYAMRVGASLEPQGAGFAVRVGPAVPATITATQARVGGAPPMLGNFLAEGIHWNAVASAIRAATTSLPSEDAVARQAVHRRFPPQTPAELASAGMAASTRLREERALVFDHRIRLRAPNLDVVFEPIRSAAGGIELPFTVEAAAGAISGALRLAAAVDPLPCRTAADAPHELLAIAWPAALVAYAEVVCMDPPPPGDPPNPRRTGAAPGGGARQRGARRPAGARLSGGLSLAQSLRPLGETRRLLASYVAGHRRRLGDGRTHSEDAARAAARVGIVLRPDETWVRPHARGMPEGSELHFSWTPPRAVSAAL